MEEYIAQDFDCPQDWVNIHLSEQSNFFSQSKENWLLFVIFSPVSGYDGFTTLHFLREGYRILKIYIYT